MKKEVVSVEWLNENLTNPNLVILDASPKSTVKGKVSPFQELCIPNAIIIDLKQNFTNKESNFPNTVPSESQFEKECQRLGINKTAKIVVYDNLGIYTSPRVWWLFKIMGHEDISVLNGGLPEWIKKGYKTVQKPASKNQNLGGNFQSNLNPEFIIRHATVVENIASNKFLLVDARSNGRFSGKEEEPRKYLKSGCIPNSKNMPYQNVLENGKFKSVEKIRELFKEQAIQKNKLVFSCGSGLTACIVLLAYEIAFKKSRYLYDGSWTEYAELNNLRKT